LLNSKIGKAEITFERSLNSIDLKEEETENEKKIKRQKRALSVL
jgi:hypothetical protein